MAAGAATHGMVAGCAWAVKFLADFLRPRLTAAIRDPDPQWAAHNLGTEPDEELRPQLQELGLEQGVMTYVDDIRLQVRGLRAQTTAALARHLYDAIAEGLRMDGAELQAKNAQRWPRAPP